MRIGVDFDNTLVSYDRAFALVGKQASFLPPDFMGNKEAVKARLLDSGPDGLRRWEKLQGLVYGRHIDRAELFEGVAEFFKCCGAGKHPVYIVSHKTELAHHDDQRTNLRECALRWMTSRKFFDREGFGLCAENVFFAGTRDEKIGRIAALECDVFIDDLVDVLGHADMPASCRKILFRSDKLGPFEAVSSWYDICDAIFGKHRGDPANG